VPHVSNDLGGQVAGGYPALDLDVVASLRRLGARTGRDVLGELTSLYLTTAETQLETARRLLAAGDFGDLARTAHALKGSGSVIGGRRVSAAAAALEETALEADGTGSPDDPRLGATLETFAAELERLREVLQELPAGP
jgi:HPt (histidine-containing phosphotransfer) domain-containing protein